MTHRCSSAGSPELAKDGSGTAFDVASQRDSTSSSYNPAIQSHLQPEPTLLCRQSCSPRMAELAGDGPGTAGTAAAGSYHAVAGRRAAGLRTASLLGGLCFWGRLRSPGLHNPRGRQRLGSARSGQAAWWEELTAGPTHVYVQLVRRVCGDCQAALEGAFLAGGKLKHVATEMCYCGRLSALSGLGVELVMQLLAGLQALGHCGVVWLVRRYTHSKHAGCAVSLVTCPMPLSG